MNVFHKPPYAKHEIVKRLKYNLNSIKMAWQRATRGYCDRDLWNLDDFYLDLFENSIRAFREDLHGTPGRLCSADATEEEWAEAHEIWVNHLKEIEDHFHNALHYEEVFTNEYADEWHRIVLSWDASENENPLATIRNITKTEGIRKKYWDRCKEIEQLRRKELRLGFEKFIEAFDDLWD